MSLAVGTPAIGTQPIVPDRARRPYGHFGGDVRLASDRLLGASAATVALVCGLALPFNLILYSAGGLDLRLLDLLCLGLAPVAALACLYRASLFLTVAMLGLLFVVPSLAHAVVLLAEQGDYRDFVFPLRFLLALPLGAALALLLDGPRNRAWFAIGLCLGCALNIIPLVFQSLGHHDAMVALGLAPEELVIPWWDIQQRPPGLHAHANATSAVVSLAIPAAVFLAVGHRRFWPIPVALAAVLACSYYTGTRSAVGIALATTVTAVILRSRPDRAFLLILPTLAFAGLLVAGLSEGPLLPESFTRLDSAGDNLAERLATMTNGVRLALEHPLGLGRTLGAAANYAVTGVEATHNGLIWLGLAVGLVPALLALVVLLAAACRAGRPGADGLRGLLAFHLFGLCLFEDHFQNQTFMALLILLLAGWLTEQLGGIELDRRGPGAERVAAGGGP